MDAKIMEKLTEEEKWLSRLTDNERNCWDVRKGHVCRDFIESFIPTIAALRADLARVAGERDAMRDAMAMVRAHTGRMPLASPELLNGLLDSIERIADAALAARAKETK